MPEAPRTYIGDLTTDANRNDAAVGDEVVITGGPSARNAVIPKAAAGTPGFIEVAADNDTTSTDKAQTPAQITSRLASNPGPQGPQGKSTVRIFRVVNHNVGSSHASTRPATPARSTYAQIEAGSSPTGWTYSVPIYDAPREDLWESLAEIDPAQRTVTPWSVPFEAGGEGPPGSAGDDGDDGWSPVYSIVSSGEKRVLRLVDYVGGTGTKPTIPANSYLGASGLTTLAAGIDVRGPQGGIGNTGNPGPAGWAPVFSVVASGDRRVLQVVDYVGGAGSKPSVPAQAYLGSSGFGTLANAIDIRGAPGSGGGGGTTVENASETARGIVELATATETRTGSDRNRAVTPAGLLAAVDGDGTVLRTLSNRFRGLFSAINVTGSQAAIIPANPRGNPLAIGNNAFAAGIGHEIAIGNNALADEEFAIRIGASASRESRWAAIEPALSNGRRTGFSSISIGDVCAAQGRQSVVFGDASRATNDQSISIGTLVNARHILTSFGQNAFGVHFTPETIPDADFGASGRFRPAYYDNGTIIADATKIRQLVGGAWVAVSGGGGGTIATLASIADVTAPTANNQILIWNSSTNRWEPGALPTGGNGGTDDPNLHFAWTRGKASGTTWADVFGLPYSYPAVPSFISTNGTTNLSLTANLPSGYTLGTDGKLTIQSSAPLWAEFTESGIDYSAVKATFNVSRSGQHQDVTFWFGADGRPANWAEWQAAGTTKGLAVGSSLSTGRVLVYRAEDNQYLGSNGTWFSSLGSVGGPADFGSFTPVEGDNAFEIVYLNGRLIVRHNGAEVNSVNLPVANQPDISGGNHGVYLARVSVAGGSTAATLRLDAVAIEDPDLEDILGEEMNGGGGPGATSFFDLTDTDTAAIGRANPNEVLVYGPSGETVSSKSEGAVVQDAIAAAGVGQTAVDNRVKSDDNLAVPGSDTPGVVQVASVGDARARQPHDRGVVNVEGMDAALSGIPTGTQLSAAATDFHRKLGVEHTAGEIEYHGGFTKAWELTITDRPNRTGTFAGDTDGLTLTGGNIRGETAKQYGIWGFRAAGPLVTLNATLVQWTDTDSAGSNVGRIWISTNSAGRLLIHNPSDPTQSTLVASADRTSGFRFSTQDSLGFASQIAVEVLKLNPDDPTDDGIEFLPTAIRADGTVTQCNNIAFTSGWARFNTRRVHLFETAGTIPIDRVKFALHAGYESHAAFAAQLAGNADTAVAWGIRTAGAGRNTPDYTGNFDFKGTLKAYNDKDELQAVVLGDDARLGSGGGGGGGGSTRTTLLQDGTSRSYTVANYANYKWLSVRVYNDNPNQARDSNANMHWDCVINTGLVETGQPLYSGGIGRGALNFAIRSTQSITGTNLELRVIDVNVSDSAAGTFGIRRVVGDS